MEVILLQKVANLGAIGDRVKVRSGFARNFLLPQGKATLASAANIEKFEARRAELERKAQEELYAAQQRAEKLKDFKLAMTAKAGTEGKLFGSIGTADIAEAITGAGHELARSEVRLPSGPIRVIGDHVVILHLHADVDVSLPVHISRRRIADRPPRRRRDQNAEGHAFRSDAAAAALGRGRAGRARRPDAGSPGLGCGRRHRHGGRFLPQRSPADLRSRGSDSRWRSQPVDVVTLSEYLERNGRLEDAGGLAYLGTLARDTPSAANIRAYAEIVRERSLLRRLISVGSDITGAAFNTEGRTARDLVDDAERRVFEIAEAGARGRGGAVRVGTILSSVVDRIDHLYRNPNDIRGVPTGFTELDRMTGGFQRGDLIIVAGRPSMGKTTLAVNIAENADARPRYSQCRLQHGNVGRAGHAAHDFLARAHRPGATCAPAASPKRTGRASTAR